MKTKLIGIGLLSAVFMVGCGDRTYIPYERCILRICPTTNRKADHILTQECLNACDGFSKEVYNPHLLEAAQTESGINNK